MSLWNKPAAEITFNDLDVFCQQKHKEGSRLDYKSDWTDDIDCLIAAFANTLGGTIILGVAGDRNNEPVWPPSGLTNPAGIADRIVQKAHDAIYPPVRPTISPLLTDPVTRKSAMVVRVDESPEAPHAVDKGRRIYVYERVDSTNKPWCLADIDRIQYLLSRRHHYEVDREALIQKALARGRSYLNGPSFAVRWASIIPLYPWRKLCDPELCYCLHCAIRGSEVQRFPDGSFGVIADGEGTESITAVGHIFLMEYPSERPSEANVPVHDFLDFRQTVELINRTTFQYAKALFENNRVERPGLLQFDVGFLNAHGKRMKSETSRIGRPYPDAEFRTQVVAPVEGLITHNVIGEQQLFRDIRFGFDLLDPHPRILT